MAFLIGGANSAADTGYNVTNGVRCTIADRPTLKRDLDTATDIDKFTVSFWFKPHTSTTDASLDSRVAQQIWGSLDGSGNNIGYLHYSDASNAQFTFFDTLSGTNPNINWSPLYRDFSAWYHIVLVGDTSQGTDTNRVKLYVNNTQITATDSATWPDQNDDWSFGNASNSHLWFDGTVGKTAWYENTPCDSSFAELAFVDGSALTPSSFGEADEDSGIWKPKSPDVTWGNNGHFMELKESGTGTAGTGTIGADTSGNDNHFTSDSLAAKHMITDTPTNNFATMNPLMSGATLAEGNLQVSGTFTSKSSIAMQNGKWYIELKCTNDNDYNPQSGIGQVGYDAVDNHAATDYPGNFTDSYSYRRDGYVYANGSNTQTGGTVVAQNEIVGFAIDLDSGTKTIKYYVEGSLTKTENLSETKSNPYVFMTYASGSQAGEGQVNFGNPVHSISSGNADANGYGNFEFAVPSGYYALCTKNLAEYG